MALGNNHGTSSHIKDCILGYKIAFIQKDTVKMDMFISSINRSHYAESTKKAALRNIKAWEKRNQ